MNWIVESKRVLIKNQKNIKSMNSYFDTLPKTISIFQKSFKVRLVNIFHWIRPWITTPNKNCPTKVTF